MVLQVGRSTWGEPHVRRRQPALELGRHGARGLQPVGVPPHRSAGGDDEFAEPGSAVARLGDPGEVVRHVSAVTLDELVS